MPWQIPNPSPKGQDLSEIVLFITKICSAIKILKNQGDVFCFCHKRMQWTALGVKKQIDGIVKWQAKNNFGGEGGKEVFKVINYK